MHRRLGSLLLLIVCGAGCARTSRTEGDATETVIADATFTVRVVNHSQLDAVIFLVHDATRTRLGTVTAATSATFPVRTRLLGDGAFNLLADPVGVLRATSSERLHVTQGTLFTWTLETDLSRSSVMVQE